MGHKYSSGVEAISILLVCVFRRFFTPISRGMEEHALRIRDPFEFQEEGSPNRIVYDGAQLSLTFIDGRSQINSRLLADNLEFFYVDHGASLGIRFSSVSFPGAIFEFRIEHENHRVKVIFEVRRGDYSTQSQVQMMEDNYLYFHDQWEARVFPPAAAAVAAAGDEDPVAANEDPVAPAARRGGRRRSSRRAGRRSRRRSRRH